MTAPQTIRRHNPLLIAAGSVLLAGVLFWASTLPWTDGASTGVANPCPESEFDCITIDARLDHSDPSKNETIPVTFAVLPARSGDPEGAFITAVGGPGASGIAVADFQYPYLGSEIRDRYDIVYFDQRGVELWDQLTCDNADLAYSDGYAELPTDPTQRWERLSILTGKYVDSCLTEMERPELLPYLTTAQAAADLEQFREEMGYGQIILYGESYGTQLAQVYATEFPEAVERLILDGVIDLTRDGLRYNADQIEATDDTLATLFAVCNRDQWCARDMGGDTSAAYSNLVDRLDTTPATVEFPIDKNTIEQVTLTAEDLSYLAFSSLYAEDDRMLFLRALAAHASGGDLVPMVRLFGMGYANGLVGAVYSTVTCLDTPYPGADLSAETAALTTARAVAPPQHRWFYEGSLTCLHWPGVDRNATSLPPFTAPGIPTLVVASDADVATPFSHAVSVVDQLEDGHLLTVHGGTHVMFGRDIPCVDEAVIAFALNGTAPSEECQVEPMSPYQSLMPTDWTGVPPEDKVYFAEAEIYWFPELIGWDTIEPLTLGCNAGGEVTFTGTETGTAFDLVGCGLGAGLVVNGDGEFDYEVGLSRLRVSLDGNACRYHYELTWSDFSESVEEVC